MSTPAHGICQQQHLRPATVAVPCGRTMGSNAQSGLEAGQRSNKGKAVGSVKHLIET